MRTWKGLPRITLFPHHHHVLCHVICCVLAREELRVCWHEGGSKGTRRSFVTEQSWRGGRYFTLACPGDREGGPPGVART